MVYKAIAIDQDTNLVHKVYTGSTYQEIREQIDNDLLFAKFHDDGTFGGWCVYDFEYDEGDGYYEPYTANIFVKGTINEELA